jgi:lysozyme
MAIMTPSIIITLPPGYSQGDPNILAGVDLSHWTADTDFGELYAAGIRFVIAKATQGATGIDPSWDTFRAKGELLMGEHPDFYFGGYHFLDGTASGVVQAAHFNMVCPAKGGQWMRGALDSETAFANVRGESWAFANAYALATGDYPTLYTYEPFYLQNLQSSFAQSIAGGHTRLWMARYRARKPDTPCDIWQFSDAERVPHDPGVMDADVFFSNDADFRAKMVGGEA